MLKLNKELYNKKNKFLNRVKQNLNLQKSSKKLDSFWELSFNDFKKEVKRVAKLKFKKSVDEKRFDEYWIEDFEETKDELLEIKERIEKTDREIDEVVYKIYEVTEKEKEIIEESL